MVLPLDWEQPATVAFPGAWNGTPPPPGIVQQGRLRLQLPLGLPNVAYAKGVVHMAPGGEGCCPHSQREGSTSGNSQATGRASHG